MGMSPRVYLGRYIVAYKTIQNFNTIEITENTITAIPQVWLQESNVKVFEINVRYNFKNSV